MSAHFTPGDDPLTVHGPWLQVFSGTARAGLEGRLPAYLHNQRWFGGKARRMKSAGFREIIPVALESVEAAITQIQVEYTEEPSETYTLALAFGSGDRSEQVLDSVPNSVLVRLFVEDQGKAKSGCLYDAVFDKDFCKALVGMTARGVDLAGAMGDLVAAPAGPLRSGPPAWVADLDVASLRTEQTNSSIVFGDKLILKLFRKTEYGINPDVEVGHFLTDKARFPHTPRVAGSIEYRLKDGTAAAVGILQEFVPNQGDAWRHTLESLRQYFDRVAARGAGEWRDLEQKPAAVEQLQQIVIPTPAKELVGPYFESIQLLGRRTAELHVALASSTDDPDFIAEPFSMPYQRSLYASMKDHSEQMFELLEKNLKSLQGTVLDEALTVLNLKSEAANRFGALLSRNITAKRIRIHGDFHLGQVLFTGTDYVIIDFEGEPARPVSERRIKRSPIRDVVGMLRSLHYAAHASLYANLGDPMVARGDFAAMEPWAQMWNVWTCASFLKSYLQHAGSGQFLPENRDELNILLNVHLLEKALYELGYELNNRPGWVRIPLSGLLQLLQSPEQAA